MDHQLQIIISECDNASALAGPRSIVLRQTESGSGFLVIRILYRCVEEGLFYPDAASSSACQALDAQAECEYADLGLKRIPPSWLHLPAMMRVLSTPFVLQRLNRRTRPYNFLFCPLIDVTVGYPQGVDRARFTLIAPFTKDRDAWLTLPCIDVADGTEYELSLV